VIRSFRDRRTAEFYRGGRVGEFQGFEHQARKRLRLLAAARQLNDLTLLPSNRLEALKGDRKGQYSIRINRQYRICFEWSGGDAHNVEIVDYH
jgi:proteic killer suppression protein